MQGYPPVSGYPNISGGAPGSQPPNRFPTVPSLMDRGNSEVPVPAPYPNPAAAPAPYPPRPIDPSIAQDEALARRLQEIENARVGDTDRRVRDELRLEEMLRSQRPAPITHANTYQPYANHAPTAAGPTPIVVPPPPGMAPLNHAISMNSSANPYPVQQPPGKKPYVHIHTQQKHPSNLTFGCFLVYLSTRACRAHMHKRYTCISIEPFVFSSLSSSMTHRHRTQPLSPASCGRLSRSWGRLPPSPAAAVLGLSRLHISPSPRPCLPQRHFPRRSGTPCSHAVSRLYSGSTAYVGAGVWCRPAYLSSPTPPEGVLVTVIFPLHFLNFLNF